MNNPEDEPSANNDLNTSQTNVIGTEPSPNNEEPKQRGSRKWIVLVLFVVLVAGAGVAYAVLRKNDTTQKPAANNLTSVTSPDATEKPLDQVLLQAGTELLAYDATTQKTEKLSTSLPKDASIVDAFISDKGWRAYYSTNNDQGQEYWFITDKAKAVRVASTKSYSISVANAKQQRLAYTEAFSIDENATEDEKTVRSYVINGQEAKLVWQSTKDYKEGDYKSPSYAVSDMTDDGKRILFVQVKFYGDGGGPANSFELDVVSGKTVAVNKAESFGKISYNDTDTGYLLTQTNDGGLGDPTPPGDVTLYAIASPGASPQKSAKLFSNEWSGVTFSRDNKLAYATTTEGDNTMGALSFGGLYQIIGSGDNDIRPLDVRNAPDGFSLNGVGRGHNNCYGASFSQYDNVNNNGTTQDIGILCFDTNTSVKYTSIKQIKTKPSDTLQTFSIVQ